MSKIILYMNSILRIVYNKMKCLKEQNLDSEQIATVCVYDSDSPDLDSFYSTDNKNQRFLSKVFLFCKSVEDRERGRKCGEVSFLSIRMSFYSLPPPAPGLLTISPHSASDHQEIHYWSLPGVTVIMSFEKMSLFTKQI